MTEATIKTEDTQAKLHLELRAEERALSVIRDATESLLRGFEEFPKDDDQVEEVMLAIQEACNNVVMHAYPEGRKGPLAVTITVDSDGVQAEVADTGRGFSLDDIPTIEPDSVPRKGGGYGVFLMRGLMDHVWVERRGMRNVVILKKDYCGAQG